MSWIKKHNAEIFRKQVREELSKRLSDRNHNCSIEAEQCGFWYGKEMYRLNVSFSYLNVTLTIRLGSSPEYWDYENETVSSACDKIIDRIKVHCYRFTSANAMNAREHFSVDFLTTYVLRILGGEE